MAKGRNKKQAAITVLEGEMSRKDELTTMLIKDKELPPMETDGFVALLDDDLDQLEEMCNKRTLYARFLAVERIIQIIPQEQDIYRLAAALKELKSEESGKGLANNTQINNYTTYLDKQVNNFKAVSDGKHKLQQDKH